MLNLLKIKFLKHIYKNELDKLMLSKDNISFNKIKNISIILDGRLEVKEAYFY